VAPNGEEMGQAGQVGGDREREGGRSQTLQGLESHSSGVWVHSQGTGEP